MSEEIQVRGVIQELEQTTSWQGTHGLYSEDGELLHVLRSDAVRLDDYVGGPVHVYGTPDPDYPGDGPDLLDVTRVHRL